MKPKRTHHGQKLNYAERCVVGSFLALAVIFAIAALFSAASAKGDDTPRYSVSSTQSEVASDLPRLDPVPGYDARPVVYFYVDGNDYFKPVDKWRCNGCRQLWNAIKANELPEWRFELRIAPSWVQIHPTLHFARPDGTYWNYPRTVEEFDGVNGFRKSYAKQFPEVSQKQSEQLAAVPVKASSDGQGSTPIDHFHKFAGDRGRFTFTPEQPIKTTLDDGTVVSYRSITGNYDFNNGRPVITLDGDKPKLQARKFFMKLGLTLDGAEYDPPSSATINTSRGKFRIQLHEAK